VLCPDCLIHDTAAEACRSANLCWWKSWDTLVWGSVAMSRLSSQWSSLSCKSSSITLENDDDVKISQNSKSVAQKTDQSSFTFEMSSTKPQIPCFDKEVLGIWVYLKQLHLVVALLFDHGESLFALIWVLLGRQQWWRWAATKWSFLGPFIPRLVPQFQLCSKAESPLFNHASRGF
jgi:hypothetical protein